MEDRVTVTRILTYSGTRAWVKDTLSKNTVNRRLQTPGGDTITEIYPTLLHFEGDVPFEDLLKGKFNGRT